MNAAEIRQSFLDFFADKKHTIVPSVPLLPTAPNLLFTNAGMNPFVPYFLGEQTSPEKRIANTQKCIRAGGKHNDLEDVGFDTYHHTFFEMLGNWSFGDYFKKEAIEWAWELLTDVWQFPKERLYVPVYKPDDNEPATFDQEAWDFWATIFQAEGLDPQKHICYGNKKDNFWMMGETGPCGPCSEIHIDLTPNGDSKGTLVNVDSPFCMEIWNLVFIQYNATDTGDFLPLSAQYVDTGMGLERIAGIMATTKHFHDFSSLPSNYNSDLFTSLFDALKKDSGHHYQGIIPQNRNQLSENECKDSAFRILADHARTIVCSIADGILPGNEGRHYVIRRILRRAVLWANRIGLPQGSFAKLAAPVIEKLGPIFPELIHQRKTIQTVLANEEETFSRTLDRGLQLFDKMTVNNSQCLSGKDAFILYDTYGFPLDLTQLIAQERNLSVDLEGFDQEMKIQQNRARAAQKKSTIRVEEKTALPENPTTFVGYDTENWKQFTTKAQAIIPKKSHTFLIFESTPFYAEMGGQTGDIGYAEINGQKLKIHDTIKSDSGSFLHKVDAFHDASIIGQEVLLSIDDQRRKNIQRHHSATHILHWALRKTLGTHVRQAGSLVVEDRLRFDCSHFEAIHPEQLQLIEAACNNRIIENAIVSTYETPFDQKPENCLAFFGEKYSKIVRVVDIGGWSVELCGGTHSKATGEIGLIKIVNESAIAAGVRRIEAIAGETAYQYVESNTSLIRKLSERLSCKTQDLEKRFQSLLNQQELLEKEHKKQRQQQATHQAESLAQKAIKKAKFDCVTSTVTVDSVGAMHPLAVQVTQKMGGKGLVILGSIFGDKTTLLALSSPEAIAAGYHAGKIIATLCQKLEGKGGGKEDFAMGGGKKTDALETALLSFAKTIKEQE